MDASISIRGARTHNLANLSIDIPRGRLTVVTGVSGSGKSSLVFDTLYAEGQRRYVQSLSTYARLFLERLDRPDVDSISEIPPAIALRQKNGIKNARSTVGSVTEIGDHLRLLFATLGRTICPTCGIEVTRDTIDSAANQVLANHGLQLFLAPHDAGSRSLPDALAYLAQNGYHRLYSNERLIETAEFAGHQHANGNRPAQPLMVVIDRIAVDGGSAQRVREALEKAFYLGGGRAQAIRIERANGAFRALQSMKFDRRFACSQCGASLPAPTPALLSPNSPLGACPTCEGFGRTIELDLQKVIPDPDRSLRQGLIAPWRTPAYREMHDWMLKCARRSRIRTAAPYREFNDHERAWLLDGEPASEGRSGSDRWPGVHGFFRWLEKRRYKTHVRILLARYRQFVECAACHGAKLRPEALNIRIGSMAIKDAGSLSISELSQWIEQVARDDATMARVGVVLRELRNRAGYLNEVGLGYLTLERQARTLSGGEAQRIHLASALGSLLTGTLYALDEPTVGLHASDARALLEVLRHLRDLGNTVVVVEHDPTMIAGADFAIELGPGGGRAGGRVMYCGAGRGARIESSATTAGRVLLMRALARRRTFGRSYPAIRIIGAREHNLKLNEVRIPLGRLVCITGVSGSGKSSLVDEVLYRNYLRRIGEAVSEVGACDRIVGLEQIGAMVHTGQELPARSLRSNPATYLKIYDDIRQLFASSPEARRLKIAPRQFSFNVDGGRCTRCHGTGTVTIEMHFMADLEVTCDVCEGRRFQSHVLAIRLGGKNVNEVLALTVDEARVFFKKHNAIIRRLDALAAVGLGYLTLGQPTSTLSGGESQRLKLARFLLHDLEPAPLAPSGKPLPRMFILDEPTIGLSSTDIKLLMRALGRLIAEGNSVVVVEHNMELIAQADYLIDLGPGGGDNGGRLVASGAPLMVAANTKSRTGRELRHLFGLPPDARRDEVRSAIAAAAEA